MTSDDKLMLTRCIQQRQAGKYVSTFEELKALLKRYPLNGLIVSEIVKLLILRNEHERAYQLYLKLSKLPESAAPLEPGCLLRLQIALSGIPISSLDGINHDQHPGWSRTYLQDGVDPLVEFQISDVLVSCISGTVDYTIVGACGSCGQQQEVSLYRTFAVWREFLCPVCFARLLLEYELLKCFLEKKYGGLMQGVYALDDKFRKIQYRLDVDAVKGEAFTRLSRYLNQDYVFILNNFLIRRLKLKS